MNFETGVEDILQRSQDVKSFRFRRPKGFDYKAGQWAYVNIKIDGASKLHHFTLSSSPTEDYLEFTKKITDHPYSVALDQMKKGDWAKINGPFGEFTFSGAHRKAGFLTGGIGVTPMRSMLRYIVDRKIDSDIRMLYSNKTAADIVFREELDSIAQEHWNIRIDHVITRDPEWNGLKGHIDASMIKEQIPDFSERVFYICGPPAMNSALKQ
ncbi:MAG TPA: FAD-dependent oxidoreductase, partial [Methanocella sp.]|nr:FAD-dependent oxidoreductase [Methanocella sp.]